eukprot:gene22394-29505_t
MDQVTIVNIAWSTNSIRLNGQAVSGTIKTGWGTKRGPWLVTLSSSQWTYLPRTFGYSRSRQHPRQHPVCTLALVLLKTIVAQKGFFAL